MAISILEIALFLSVSCCFAPSMNGASVNLALKRPASQSVGICYRGIDYPAFLAVDGNSDPSFFDGSCTHGGDSAADGWFVVDLGQPYHIQKVAVVGRSDCCPERMDKFIVGVTNNFSQSVRPINGSYPLCGQFPTAAQSTGAMTVNCSVNTPPGQFVIIQLPPDDYGLITICDLEVTGYATTEDQFLGCYQNMFASCSVRNQPSLTIQWCIGYCRDNRYTFAALQNGDSCFCGDVLQLSVPAENCHSICSGDPNQYCGGRLNFAVYTVCPFGYYGPNCEDRCHCRDEKPCDIQTGTCPNGCDVLWTGTKCNVFTSDNAVSKQYMGCFSDKQNISSPYSLHRDMFGFRTSDNRMTVDKCFALCLSNGYPYSGVESSTVCYCDMVYGRFGQQPDSSCNMPCAGNNTQVCGGPNENSVYSVLCPNGTYGWNCSKLCHCANNSRCSPDGRCLSAGCERGWTGTSCNERNCNEGNGACGVEEDCHTIDLKSATVARCECRKGYQRLNFRDCTDINECDNRTACDNQTEACVNTMGSYRCLCLAGYYSSDLGRPYTCQVQVQSTSHTCNTSEGPGMIIIIILAVLLGVSVLVNISLVIDKIREKLRRHSEPRSTPAALDDVRVAVTKNDSNLHEMNGGKYEGATDSKQSDDNYEELAPKERETNLYTDTYNRRTMIAA